VLEETGLVVTACRLLFDFDERITHTYVFTAEVEGEVKDSWEGEPRWVSPFGIAVGYIFGPRAGTRNARRTIGAPAHSPDRQFGTLSQYAVGVC